ncbi:hypothetical protein YC2023_110175 [Brassica napus]
MDIIRDRTKGTLVLSQENYLEKVLKSFGMSEAKEVTTPTSTQFKLKSATRRSLTFTKHSKFSIEGFCDSDYATDLDRRRSVTGFVFQVWGNTGLSKSFITYNRRDKDSSIIKEKKNSRASFKRNRRRVKEEVAAYELHRSYDEGVLSRSIITVSRSRCNIKMTSSIRRLLATDRRRNLAKPSPDRIIKIAQEELKPLFWCVCDLVEEETRRGEVSWATRWRL